MWWNVTWYWHAVRSMLFAWCVAATDLVMVDVNIPTLPTALPPLPPHTPHLHTTPPRTPHTYHLPHTLHTPHHHHTLPHLPHATLPRTVGKKKQHNGEQRDMQHGVPTAAQQAYRAQHGERR